MNPTLQTVHVRINDATTGQPTPVRVRFTDADGIYYAPLGRLTDFATGHNQDVGGNVRLGGKAWAYVEGSFEINLPPGLIQVEIHKGPEYLPISHQVQLQPGKLALRFTIERWLDLPSMGWYSGDGRTHFLSPCGALLEAQAEDVHVVNLLATSATISARGKTKPVFANILDFSGQTPALETPGYLVVVNSHNYHPLLGGLGLLNSHRVVYPLTFGDPPAPDNWTLAAWCDQCHRKNGLVVWTRTWQENADFFAGEVLADAVLGKVDAFEFEHFEDSPVEVLPWWYCLLNAGIRLPLLGSSGKESNASALGVMRTYARLQAGEALTYQTWIEAVRAGRTFVSNGPALFFTVNDVDPGAVLHLDQAETTVQVRAEVKSQAPWQHLEILLNGDVVADTVQAVLAMSIRIKEGAWLAARCRGDRRIFDRPANQSLFAHSSPVYVRVEGSRPWVCATARAEMLGHIDALEIWAKTRANVTERDRERFLALANEARQVLL